MATPYGGCGDLSTDFGGRGLEPSGRAGRAATGTPGLLAGAAGGPPIIAAAVGDESPGDRLLDFRIAPLGQACELQISSRFLPKGLGGISYWYAFYAFHTYYFGAC